MKKIIAIILALFIVCLSMTGCSGYNDVTADIEVQKSQDNYRNFYQIWVPSFCDSDGDTIGDLQGVISKLDYLNDGDPTTDTDLGIEGIWFSPIMPSYSYHKYNVSDYYNIDPAFGSLEVFDTLVEECHKRNISVVMDLVLNHSATDNPYFEQAYEQVKEGKLDDYAQYYNFTKEGQSGVYHAVEGTDYYYEGQFSPEMPDWNLSYEGTREFFEDVTKFWLDRGVDGFRLDAVKYFGDAKTEGNEFLSWFMDMARSYNPDVYVVGELWSVNSDIYDCYPSGIDSLFAFGFSNSDGNFISFTRLGNGQELIEKIYKYDTRIHEENPNAINAFFLSNHDMVRSANALSELEDKKMAAAICGLSPGNSFIYNGEEIGIKAESTDSDKYYRTGMIWDSEQLPDITINGEKAVVDSQYGGVKQQESDESSLLNFYKRIIKIDNQNPELARGTITEVVELDPAIGAYFVEYDSSKLLVIHNVGKEEKTVNISEILPEAQIRADLVASDCEEYEKKDSQWHITLDDEGNLYLPAKSTVILK